MADMNENVIEWLDGEDVIAVTLHQKRFVNQVRNLAKQDKNVEILAQNSDGSIFAHLPISYLKLRRNRTVNQTAEEKSEWAERMRQLREEKT